MAQRAMGVAILGFLMMVSLGSATPNISAPVEDGLVLLTVEPGMALDQARQGHLELAFPGGAWVLKLEANPIAEGAVWGHGQTPMGVVTETVTFKGTATGPLGVFPVRIAVTQAGLMGVIFTPDALHIQPAWINQPDAPLSAHHVIPASRIPLVLQDEETKAVHPTMPTTLGTTGSQDADRTARFLLESDLVFYMRFSLQGKCQDCWIQAQQAILNVAEGLFEPQTGVSFQITSQWACDTMQACPYPFTSSFLMAFKDRWDAIDWEPLHETAHLLHSTDLPGQVGSACTACLPNAYAESEILAFGEGDLGFLSYSTPAHEIGHNFDARHQEAVSRPPSIPAPVPREQVWTIMAPGKNPRFEFSDGTDAFDPAHNNVARIVAHAQAQLPAS